MKTIATTFRRLIVGLALSLCPLIIILSNDIHFSIFQSTVFIAWCWLVGLIVDHVARVAFKSSFKNYEDRSMALESLTEAGIKDTKRTDEESDLLACLSFVIIARNNGKLPFLHKALTSPEILLGVEPKLHEEIERIKAQLKKNAGGESSAGSESSSNDDEIAI